MVCSLAAVAMNILWLIGQNALIGKDAPLRHAAKRRRMKTVMQEIMFMAGRMIKHARRWVLGLGANDSAHTVFERLYRQLTPAHKTSTAQAPGLTAGHSPSSLQNHIAARVCACRHAQTLTPHATTA